MPVDLLKFPQLVLVAAARAIQACLVKEKFSAALILVLTQSKRVTVNHRKLMLSMCKTTLSAIITPSTLVKGFAQLSLV